MQGRCTAKKRFQPIWKFWFEKPKDMIECVELTKMSVSESIDFWRESIFLGERWKKMNRFEEMKYGNL